ncbi:SRA stem-loop-interacting RNA-binding protein, mitochondrial-like [Limulus polyphemus]|uniref:SRA stem-loop-interacting RNA-binding protein, mitochondrial-like n=1 Tax=Limulus polyphemus TaxID=6850 RepID=A0ABM1BH99_LIMPO|nr:SRA stem-loop-interacting RNA-binding protein, mitochondrial-like [Limulus polyphemus]
MASRSIHRIFVGNLPWTVSRRELKEYFSQFGYVASALVIFNKDTGMSRGYGFVNFAKREGYISATKQDGHVLEGSVIRVQPTNNS